MVTGISFSNHLMKLWFKLLFETAVEFDILRYALLLRIRNSCKIFNISSLFILFIYNIKLLQIEFYYLWNNRIICTKKWILARHKKIRKTKVEKRTVWRKRSHKFVSCDILSWRQNVMFKRLTKILDNKFSSIFFAILQSQKRVSKINWW
jgi:hypothetical protein